ncbi:lysozyme inhibitor LprI family protein [Clostridium sp. AL.422]|uniref:lysozyme inhibitor LprI family protein n=1 Tax=Clostridium TaxID=1485 RepID=UPI00293DF5FC|nr:MULTISPECIES: lysozyme inhibitor LprI family protein [unclassified Clostridium]MDV4149868.1 lysozyme inhibitor LprI family protein [Clostridium sp. AL.422]
MKKLIVCLLFSTMLFTACSVKEDTNSEILSDNKVNGTINETNVEKDNGTEDKLKVNENLHNSEEGIKENSSSENVSSKKNEYLERLNQLEAELDSSLKKKYDSGITLEMTEAASKEYEQWDYMLNDIYSYLREILTSEEMDKLTEEQLNWIALRDKKAEEADKEFEGGTFAPVNKILSLKTTTKERCYELVELYMN